jgi:hypothetical protein
MRPTGTVSGRLLDQRGQPRAHVRLDVMIWGKRSGEPSLFEDRDLAVTTDEQGRFEIRGVIPGSSCRVDVHWTGRPGQGGQREGYVKSQRWTLEPGESRNWGDVRVTPF